MGLLPQIFILASIASGLEKIIDQNLEAPSIMNVISSPGIYIPLIIFLGLVVVTIFFRKLFYKN